MKKALSFLLTLMLILTLAVPALAEDDPATSGSSTVTDFSSSGEASIVAIYEKTEDVVVNKYSVTVAWSQTGTLKYNTGEVTYSWDSDKLEYDMTAKDGVWTCEDAKIAVTVTNKSDKAITATCADPAVNGDVGVTAIKGSYDNGTLSLSSAAKGLTEKGEAVSATATYTISGVEGAIKESGNIGTITVSFAAATAN
jgi:hypothetical protein